MKIKTNYINSFELGSEVAYHAVNAKIYLVMKPSLSIFVFLILLFTASQNVVAQPKTERTSPTENFDYALKLLNSFKIDSAKIVLNALVKKLKAQRQFNSELGIKARLRQAEVWEHDYNDQEAITSLLVIIDESRKAQYWDVVAEAHISLARLYERHEQANKCFTHLKIAQNTISTHDLNEIYPKFAVRMASYYRVFAKQLDSASYYAKRALETVPKNKLSIDEGTAHLLLAIINLKNKPQLAIDHYKKAGNVFRQIEDFTGYSFVLMGLSRAYLKTGQAEKALAYNDTATIATVKVMDKTMGQEHSYLLANPVLIRAEIFKYMGNLDSSWYYLNEYHRIEMKALRNAEAEKILEVEAQYNDEIKSQKIAEQQLALKAETNRKYLISGALMIVFVFAGIILFLYVKLRQLYRHTKEQAHEIYNTNLDLRRSLNQQGLLQREVHHRVTNNLQTIISLLEIQAEGVEDSLVKETFNAMANRIYSMAAVHAMLYKHQDLEVVGMQEYTELLCQHLHSLVSKSRAVSYTINMNAENLNLPTVIPIGIILNELITNSIKHFPKTKNNLKFSIDLVKREDEYLLCYCDNGDGMDEASLKAKNTKGLGLYLIKSMIRQLDGTLKMYNEQGAVFEIVFKAKNNRSN